MPGMHVMKDDLRPQTTTDPRIEVVAKALWRYGHPEDGGFSRAAPNDWDKWPDTPRACSLAMEDHSRQEYRDMARVAIAALEAFDVRV